MIITLSTRVVTQYRFSAGFRATVKDCVSYLSVIYATTRNEGAIREGLLLQQLDLKKGDLTAAFKSYGLKTKRRR